MLGQKPKSKAVGIGKVHRRTGGTTVWGGTECAGTGQKRARPEEQTLETSRT